jgi:hypothetical protein
MRHALGNFGCLYGIKGQVIRKENNKHALFRANKKPLFVKIITKTFEARISNHQDRKHRRGGTP